MNGEQEFEKVKKVMDSLNEILCSYPGRSHQSVYRDVDALVLFTDLLLRKYYIEDKHEAIIPKELFHRVQEEKARCSAINRPALSQTGMVKVRTEMGGVALRQPPEVRLQAV